MIYIETGLTRAELYKIPLVASPLKWNPSENWKPIQHGELADLVISQIRNAGLVPGEEKWDVGKNSANLVGAIEIRGVETKGINPLPAGIPIRFMLGIKHSNDGRCALQFCVGAQITVCANGLFSGDIRVVSKHVQSLSIEDMVQGAIQEYILKSRDLGNYITSLKDIWIDDRTAALMAIKSTQEYNVFADKYITNVWDKWEFPEFKEFTDRNLWSFYNCFTSVIKEMSPRLQIDALPKLHQMMEVYKVRLKRENNEE